MRGHVLAFREWLRLGLAKARFSVSGVSNGPTPVYATIPIILLSSQPDLEEQAVRLGTVASLRKPLTILDGLPKLIHDLMVGTQSHKCSCMRAPG